MSQSKIKCASCKKRIPDHEPDIILRDLYRRNPETRYLLAWELQILLWSLGYTDKLLDEAEIAAAVKVVWREFFVPFGPTRIAA